MEKKHQEKAEEHQQEIKNSQKREQKVLKQKYEEAEKHRQESQNTEKWRQEVLKQKDEEAKKHGQDKNEVLDDTKKRRQEDLKQHKEEIKNIRTEAKRQQRLADENNVTTYTDMALKTVGVVAGGTAITAAAVAAALETVIAVLVAGEIAGVTVIVKGVKYLWNKQRPTGEWRTK